MDACCSRSWIREEFPSHNFLLRKEWRGLAVPDSQAGVKEDCAALVGSLKVCTRSKDLHRGTRLHDDILRKGLLKKCSDALVTMYAKCGELGKAKVILDTHSSSDVVTWTAMISGYARAGKGQNALDCFDFMKREGVLPNVVTYTCTLKACAAIANAERGKEIHDEIIRCGLLQESIILGTALVDMYAKCGALHKAQDVLQNLPPPRGVASGISMQICNSRDVIAWTALIAGYGREGQAQSALECYNCMQNEGIFPNGFTYACVLKACAIIGAVNEGTEVHDEIISQGLLQNDTVLGTALVDMYGRCGALSSAHDVLVKLPFRTVSAWNALIGGYVEGGQGEQALSCFEHMQSEGALPDEMTHSYALKACAMLGEANKGKEIHDEIERQGLLHKSSRLATALVDMYGKCGAFPKAQAVLDILSVSKAGPWNALIAGYAQDGKSEEVLQCYARMQHGGVAPDAVTYASILKACGIMGRIDKGIEIHDEIIQQGLLQDNLVLGAALIDMYAKCGAASKARVVLQELPSRNVIVWSALIAGYALKGQWKQVLCCLENMQHEGIHPNVVTFICVLNACSHLGLVEEGHAIFMSMSNFGVKPSLECYTCMIDLFGRAGHPEKSVQVIRKMPSSDHPEIWLSLLASCQKWGDVNVARWAFEQAVHLDKNDGLAYVLMANIYATAVIPEFAKKTETINFRNQVWEKSGHSWWTKRNEEYFMLSIKDLDYTHITVAPT